MKKYFHLFICAFLPVAATAQTTVTIYAIGASGSYKTGNSTETLPAATYTRNDGTIAVTNSSTSRQAGYAVFDLSSIPANVTISSVTLGLNVSGATLATYSTCVTYGHTGDLSTSLSAAVLYNDCATTTFGTSNIIAVANAATDPGSYLIPGVTGVGEMDMSSSNLPGLITFVSNVISSPGQIGSISFSSSGPPSSSFANVYNFTGETGSSSTTGPHAPFLQITYALCSGVPPTSTINANVLSACNTTNVTLTDAGSSSGFYYQWQSSPDSLTWSNVTGATSSAFTFNGLSTTMYYRSLVTCSSSGLSSPSEGQKITYALCCSATPTAGMATANTTSCSACSLTLGLTGYSSAGGITFQWQYSSDNISWTNMAGATTTPYTFIPSSQSYYRCIVTCSSSGLSANSAGVFVAYPYMIVGDSVINPASATCDPPQFYVNVNGTSPLLYLKTYFGDGNYDSVALINNGTTSSVSPSHVYTCPGYYTVKQVLYYNNIPQDSIDFNYHYLFCKIFSLEFYEDRNGNCLKDGTEPFNSIPVTVVVDSAGVPVDTISTTSGFYYRALGGVGTIYSFQISSGNAYISCPAGSTLYDTVQLTINKYPVSYVALNCTSGFDLAVNAVIPVTGIHDQWGNIYVRNNFCTPTNATVTLHYSPKYNVLMGITSIDVNPVPTSYTSSSITWNLLGLTADSSNPTHLYYTLWTNLVGHYATVGDTTNSYITVTPIIGDPDTLNNNIVVIDTVKSGVDPNYMLVSPGCFTNDTQSQYTIHFENTGNDTAHNIYVMDTLSDYMDMKSMRLVTATAPMDIEIFNDGTHNIAKFDFRQINLLDSSHHGFCDGAVIFTIKNKAGIPTGTTITSEAGIYFDINPVVMTNTVENVKGCPVTALPQMAVKNSNVEIYPNPTNDELTIQMATGSYNSFTITDNVGQVLVSQQLAGSTTKVNVKNLPAGMYYITMKGDNGAITRKFVKM